MKIKNLALITLLAIAGCGTDNKSRVTMEVYETNLAVDIDCPAQTEMTTILLGVSKGQHGIFSKKCGYYGQPGTRFEAFISHDLNRDNYYGLRPERYSLNTY